MSEKMRPSHELMLRVRQAFLAYGYDGMSMVTLAKACGFTRRSLYNYFSNKEEAFRTMIRFDNVDFVRVGMAAGDGVRRNGGSALDIVSEILDSRYGFARRLLNESPHAIEVNAEAFRRCRDIMIDAAIAFQTELEQLLVDLGRDGLLRINPDVSAKEVAQMLADGGRAVNQSLPPIATPDFPARYRAMCRAVLYGSATVSAGRAKRTAKKPSSSKR
jgi:AcrR family transcriptional regulator